MRLFFALLLLGLGSAVTCLELEPLCPSDHFNYQGVRVNGIHRLQTNVTLEPVSEFLVPLFDNCLEEKWWFPKYKSEAEGIKDTYNNLLIRVYSERFLNSKYLDQYSFKMKLDKASRMATRMAVIAKEEYAENCLKGKFISPMQKGAELIRHLASLYGEQLPPTDEQGLRLGKKKMFGKFESEIERMAKNANDSQTAAFQFDLITDVYKKPIVRMGKFVFHKKSKIVFDLRSTGTVNFEIVMPFEDTELQAGKDCVSTADLPKFFPRPESVTTPAYEVPTGTTSE